MDLQVALPRIEREVAIAGAGTVPTPNINAFRLAQPPASTFISRHLHWQGHGESEGARGLRGFFEAFDDLAIDLLQLHDVVRRETDGSLPIFWLGTSMGGAVACRAVQMRASAPDGLVMLAPMISLAKVQRTRRCWPTKAAPPKKMPHACVVSRDARGRSLRRQCAVRSGIGAPERQR